MQQILLRSWPVTWALLALAALFGAVGLLLLIFPVQGSAWFGIEARNPSAISYVRVLALRDVAFAAYLALQTLFASARAVTILLLATLVIPFGDFGLVAVASTAGTPPLLLHLASAAAFAAMAAWVRHAARGHTSREEN